MTITDDAGGRSPFGWVSYVRRLHPELARNMHTKEVFVETEKVSWRAPTEWSGSNVSAWLVFGLAG